MTTTPLSIAHVYNYLNPEAGGPPQVIAQLGAQQAAQGHRVTLISHDVLSPPVERFMRAAWADAAPPELLRLDNVEFFLSGLWGRAPARLVEALREVDLVHLHSIWPTQGVSAALACQALGRPYVLSLHGHLRGEALRIKALKKRIGLRLAYQRMIEGAAAYHALNESELSDAQRFGLKGLIEVIPNGATAARGYRAERELLPSPLRSALGDAPYLLFLSRVHPPKGARDLVEAFAQLAEASPELQLVVAGRDEDGGVAELLEVAQRSALLSRVHIAGFLTGDEKRAALDNALIFCLPSYHEGFSVAILEAMAARVPVVISEGCHFPTVAREELGWVHAQGAEALSEALNEALSQPEERARRVDRAERWVSKNATWEQVAARFERLYRSLTP